MRRLTAMVAAIVTTQLLVLAGPVAPASATPAGNDWELTVYYTPVSTYYGSATQWLPACNRSEPGAGNGGWWVPPSFVPLTDPDTSEGWGKVGGVYVQTSGSCAHSATAPLDAQDRALIAWRSAAADPSIPFGTTFAVTGCGSDMTDNQQPCVGVKTSGWIVSDRGPAVTGHHVDLYIGDQFQSDMSTAWDWFDSFGASVSLNTPHVEAWMDANWNVQVQGWHFSPWKRPVDIWVIDFTTNQTIGFTSNAQADGAGNVWVTLYPWSRVPCGHNTRVIAKNGDYNDASAEWTNVSWVLCN